MSDQIAQPPPDTADPLVAQASPAGWRVWLLSLTTGGRNRLAALGLALVVGFLAGGLVMFASIADDVTEGETQILDNAVLAWLQQFQSPLVDVLARTASAMGSEVV